MGSRYRLQNTYYTYKVIEEVLGPDVVEKLKQLKQLTDGKKSNILSLRQYVEETGPTTQCNNVIGRVTTYNGKNLIVNGKIGCTVCYICGLPLLDRKLKTTGMTPECEHKLPIVAGAIYLELYSTKKKTKIITDDQYNHRIKLMYGWAHDVCNKEKSDIFPYVLVRKEPVGGGGGGAPAAAPLSVTAPVASRAPPASIAAQPPVAPPSIAAQPPVAPPSIAAPPPVARASIAAPPPVTRASIAAPPPTNSLMDGGARKQGHHPFKQHKQGHNRSRKRGFKVLNKTRKNLGPNKPGMNKPLLKPPHEVKRKGKGIIQVPYDINKDINLSNLKILIKNKVVLNSTPHYYGDVLILNKDIIINLLKNIWNTKRENSSYFKKTLVNIYETETEFIEYRYNYLANIFNEISSFVNKTTTSNNISATYLLMLAGMTEFLTCRPDLARDVGLPYIDMATIKENGVDIAKSAVAKTMEGMINEENMEGILNEDVTEIKKATKILESLRVPMRKEIERATQILHSIRNPVRQP